jgi:spermidine/putrescine transport system permease protein
MSSRILLAAVTAFLYLPVAVLVVFSFNASEVMAFPLSGFTWHWYGVLANNDNFWNGFVASLLIAQPVGLLGTLIALATALALADRRPLRGRMVLIGLLLIPFLVPKSVLSIAQAMIMSRVGIPRGATVLILAQTLMVLPFTTALIASVLVRLDPRLEEAARDLGALPWQAFRRVTLPQLKAAIGAAYSVAVILSLSDLAISMFLSGRTQPLSLIVASQFRRELTPDLNAMQVVVLAVTVLLVTVSELLRRRQTKAQTIPFDIQPAAALGHRA